MKYLFLFSLMLPKLDHAIYVSLTAVEIHEHLEWSAQLQLFYDDLEDAIQNQEGKRPTLSQTQLPVYFGSIARYISDHFFMQYDGHQMTYHLNKVYRENELVVIELVGDEKWPTHEVEITNDLLLEIFESQKNIVKVKALDKVRMLYFKKGQVLEKYSI